MVSSMLPPVDAVPPVPARETRPVPRFPPQLRFRQLLQPDSPRNRPTIPPVCCAARSRRAPNAGCAGNLGVKLPSPMSLLQPKVAKAPRPAALSKLRAAIDRQKLPLKTKPLVFGPKTGVTLAKRLLLAFALEPLP